MRTRTFFRGLDHKTIVALIALLVVCFAMWRLVQQQHDIADRGRQIDSLIATVRQGERDAAHDRDIAAQNQRALLEYTKALATRQDALLAWLRAHGIRLPSRYVTTIPAPRLLAIHHRPGRHTLSSPRHSSSPAAPSSTRHHQAHGSKPAGPSHKTAHTHGHGKGHAHPHRAHRHGHRHGGRGHHRH